MSTKRVLSDEQINEGKKLRIQGYTKAQLAEMFGVGKTTIWENIFSEKKRVRLFKKKMKRKEKFVCNPCANCEICMVQEWSDDFIPNRLQIDDKCLKCYIRNLGVNLNNFYKKGW